MEDNECQIEEEVSWPLIPASQLLGRAIKKAGSNPGSGRSPGGLQSMWSQS